MRPRITRLRIKFRPHGLDIRAEAQSPRGTHFTVRGSKETLVARGSVERTEVLVDYLGRLTAE